MICIDYICTNISPADSKTYIDSMYNIKTGARRENELYSLTMSQEDLENLLTGLQISLSNEDNVRWRYLDVMDKLYARLKIILKRKEE